MRVPDISSTAGYAARITQLSNKEISTNFPFSITRGEFEQHNNKINGNLEQCIQSSNSYNSSLQYSYNQQPQEQHQQPEAVYMSTTSTADEFIQRALNSAQIHHPYTNTTTNNTSAPPLPTLQRSTTTTTTTTIPSKRRIGSGVQNHCYVNNDLEDINVNSAEADSTENTYRSFKEVFNINKTIFKECDKDFGNINTLEHVDFTTDIDPIVIINSQLNKESDNEFDSKENCISPINLDMRDDDDGRHIKTLSHFTNTDLNLRYENDLEQDYEDQTMIDLCNGSTKSIYDNDDLDEYLTSSPTSPSGSLHTSQKHSYFPRGIINPNYPGFQHLAHKLSEHFIIERSGREGASGILSDSYDSDMSEDEMEFSTDSCDEFPEAKPQQQQVQHNAKMNSYNNNNNTSATKTMKLNNHFDDNIQKPQIPRATVTAIITTSDANLNSTANTSINTREDDDGIHNLEDNLETVLTLLESPSIVTMLESTKKYPTKPTNVKYQQQIAAHKCDSVTPDILIENYSTHLRVLEPLSKKENRPDLLRGVSPQPTRNIKSLELERNQHSHQIINDDCDVKQVMKGSATAVTHLANNLCNMRTSEQQQQQQQHGTKEEISFGMTPVDIIGDFEQEVEREFGLLVSGYRRLVNGCIPDANEEVEGNTIQQPEKQISDALLSSATDQIDPNKFLATIHHDRRQDDDVMCGDDEFHQDSKEFSTITTDFIEEDNNAVDWSCSSVSVEIPEADISTTTTITTTTTTTNTTQQQFANEIVIDDYRNDGTTALAVKADDDDDGGSNTDNSNNCEQLLRKPTKYQKHSYDERQLPPVVIDYKRCQQSMRSSSSRKSQQQTTGNIEKNTTKGSNLKIGRNHHTKTSFSNRFFNTHSTKRSNGLMSNLKGNTDKSAEMANRKREEAELNQYQQLISDKELILSNSRYAKMSSWAQYLKNSVKDQSGGGLKSSSDLISPSALELFDAYKIGSEIDMETLQKHLKMAKEIEKKRRSDREEIRRRLAMGAEENCNETSDRSSAIWKPSLQSSKAHSGIHFCRASDASSDTESHSSDSETCPKLSKARHQNNLDFLGINLTSDKPQMHPHNGRPLSVVSCSNNNRQQEEIQQLQLKQKTQQQQQPISFSATIISNEDKECGDFFTKQAKLQIEARMALAQAKEMAHMQMEIERQQQRMSPITDIIRGSLDKIGIQMTTDKRRVSRQMLTDMNIAQLQILVNNLHTHIEQLNESLVHILMERDDLHMAQDTMLVDIEELTRYIGVKENLAQQQQDRKSTLYNRSK